MHRIDYLRYQIVPSAIESAGAKLLLMFWAGLMCCHISKANDKKDKPEVSEKTHPRVLSIEVFGHPKSNVSAVEFLVTFSEPVTGVDVTDFAVKASTQIEGAVVSKLSGSGTKYKVKVGDIPLDADGILRIDLKGTDTEISNEAGFMVPAFTNGRYHYIGAAFDVSRAVFSGNSERFSVRKQSEMPQGMIFTNDGLKMLVIERDLATIFQYGLSSAYELSTAEYLGDSKSLFVGDKEPLPRTLAFDDTGLKLFISGGDKTALIQQYDLSKPFEVSTARYAGDDKRLNVWDQEVNPRSIHFSNDGSKLFLVGLVDDEVNEYQLEEPYNLSTAIFAGESEKLTVREFDESARVINFNTDGTKMYIIGGSANIVNEFSLLNPFDVSTAKFSGFDESLLFGKQELTPNGMSFNEDGTKLFIIGQDKDFVNEYVLDAQALNLASFSLWSIGDISEPDSLIFQQAGMADPSTLRLRSKDLRLEYFTNSSNPHDQIEFQTLLEGEDATWSDWTAENQRAYPRLRYGTYRFKIKARNAYGQETGILEFSFRLLTPWYFTVWAYLVYGFMILGLIWFVIKYNARKLEKEKRELERVVGERTEEISRQKDEIALQMNEVEQANVLIKEQADRLQELDKVKSRFFANISHELRTPLTLINAPLEALIKNGKIEDEEALQTLGVVRKNGDSLLSLVEEILDLTKLEAGKVNLVKNPVRLSEFVSDLIKPYERGLKDKAISLNVDFQLGQDLAIQWDANHAGKILNNLLSNALKFTPYGGSIELIVQFKPNMAEVIQIMVKDNGEGIHPNDVLHVFDRFYQSEQPEKKAAGGTGIGLALAKELAHLFEGTLEVESTLGEGSVFTFEFPFEEITTDVILPSASIGYEDLEIALKHTIKKYASRFDVGKPVLLITEDHPEMRAFIAQTLQPYFEVRQAENGRVALETLKKERIDIVVSDVMMPEMDGFELLEAIKQDKSLHEVSLVMLTARAEQEDKLFALTMGIDDYLIKPFNASEFLARIKNILENRIKLLRELNGIESQGSIPFSADVQALMKAHDLSERELEVIPLIAKRYTNPEIAEHLHVSRNTVKTHLKNIYSKLDISSRSEITEKLREFSK